ncbi:terminase large subunit domain-containing protein [Sphingomonas rhizophila]|uniref:terminase large subunit domain-containing protein n=1 Tax=Sphingomonas rhizophila TaxID=2071607 RepID=UPI001FE5E2F9|nr:terminase family protein [Sphingomonas rhizophila]
MIMAGRGFGKTRAGSAFVHATANAGSGATRIALVGQTREEVVRVMVEGPSGLLATAAPDARVRWVPTAGRIEWPSGASAFAYSAENAEGLRGPEHDAAWCDELGKWGASVGRGHGRAGARRRRGTTS